MISELLMHAKSNIIGREVAIDLPRSCATSSLWKSRLDC